jgi:hypothetical protein
MPGGDIMQTLIKHQAAEQISAATLREWQRYRGWTIKILEELEHSGGMTTREISDRTGCRCHTTATILGRMMHSDLVEKVERWGWRITRDGLVLLSINYVNTTTTQQQHNVNTTSTQEKSEPVPACFRVATCHIKQICQDKGYTRKNMVLCQYCVWYDPRAWSLRIAPVEIKVMGDIGNKLESESLKSV